MAEDRAVTHWNAIAVLLITSQASAGPLTEVKIDFIEALAPRDTTSSDRFQEDYEKAIQSGKRHLEEKLARCGYSLQVRTAFYEASDALKAKELAAKSQSEGTWLIVGPRRSNHYLLLAQGSPDTPTISLMASADDVSSLGSRHVSLSPSNSQMAEVAAQEAQARKGARATYITVLSDDCTNCVDFAKAFDRQASRLGLRKKGEIAVQGEAFEIRPILENVTIKKPDFILLPNYSRVSGHVMAAFRESKDSPLFVGGDGWGDNRYGFVQNGQDLGSAIGITVRGYPPLEQGLTQFDLGKNVAKANQAPTFAPSMGILRALDSTSELLCSQKPKTRAQFAQAFESVSPKAFHAPWGTSIYELKAGEISFIHKRASK